MFWPPLHALHRLAEEKAQMGSFGPAAFGRFLSNVRVKLDHKFEDVATPSHPGSDTIGG